MRVVILSVLALFAGAGAGIVLGRLRCGDGGAQWKQLLDSPHRTVSQIKRVMADRIVVENGAEFDFGVMEREQTRSHVFRIRNQTNRPVALSILDKTCKCTVEHLPEGEIPAGEVADVTLEWTAKTFDSEFRQSATLRTTDPVQGLVTLTVFGRVMQVVSADPSEIAFSNVALGQSAEREFVLRSFEDDVLDVSRIEWRDAELGKFFDVTWRPADAPSIPGLPDPKAALSGILRLKPGIPIGAFEQTLTLHTTARRSGKITMQIGGNVVSDLMVVGPGYNDRTLTLDLGVVDAAKGLQRTLRLLAKGDASKSFAVTNVAVDPEDVLQVHVGKAKDINQGAVRSVPIEITIPPHSRTAYYLGGENRPSGKITLTTTHPTVRELNIETRFSVVADARGGERE